MKFVCTAVLLASRLPAQQAAAPPVTAQPLDPARPFPGWAAFQGNFVIVDFWATWCGPCIPGLDKIVAMKKEFAGKPVRFLTVANDTLERVRRYYCDKAIGVLTFVEGEDDRRTLEA